MTPDDSYDFTITTYLSLAPFGVGQREGHFTSKHGFVRVFVSAPTVPKLKSISPSFARAAAIIGSFTASSATRRSPAWRASSPTMW